MENLRINPLKYPNVCCDKCGHQIFLTGVILKKLPGIEIGTGIDDQLMDFPICYCAKCGEILKEHRETYKLDEFAEEKIEGNTENVTKSGIFLSV